MTTFTVEIQILINQSVFLIVGDGNCFSFLILPLNDFILSIYIKLKFLQKKNIREALIECFLKKMT
jgi:hypothetical protein